MQARIQTFIQAELDNITPSIWSYGRSFFTPQTRFAPVDLEKNLEAGKYQCPEAQLIETAQRIVGSEAVQQVFVERLDYDPATFQQKNQVLENHGFTLLSKKPQITPGGFVEHPYYNVSEHPELGGWILKTGANRIPEHSLLLSIMNDQNEMAHFNQHESLLRLEMGEKLREAAQKHGIDLVVPKEYAIPFANPERFDPNGIDVTKRYFIVSEKIDVLSVDETVEALKADEALQKKFAADVIKLVQETGYCDTSIDNIRLTRDHKIAVLDTEPVGVLTKSGDTVHPKAGSLEKHTRVGLCNFVANAKIKGLPIAKAMANESYNEALNTLSITRIALGVLSVLVPLAILLTSVYNPALFFTYFTPHTLTVLQVGLGVLAALPPIALLVISIVQQWRIASALRELLIKDIKFAQTNQSRAARDPEGFKAAKEEHDKGSISLRRWFFSMIEDVPSPNPAMQMA